VITVPTEFARRFNSLDERRWIAELPTLVEHYLQRWSLQRDRELLHGNVALVVPVRAADGEPAMLKLSWPHEEVLDEPVALRAWNGSGAVRLLEYDAAQCVLLLERLDDARSLADEPIDQAVRIAGGLLRRLAVPPPPLHRSLADIAERWQRELPTEAARFGSTVPARLVDEAVAHCRELAPDVKFLMVNEDLHYDNVLSASREPWLVIDPKVVCGDPEFGVIPLLRNRFDELDGPGELRVRFDAIVDAAGLDRQRAQAWTFVRAIDNWLDFLDEDEPIDTWAAAAIAECLSSR